jgi:multicomponent Na+:H+ antiporter subunit F
MTFSNLDTVASEIALSMVGIAILLAVLRLIRGPSLPDRVVALDLISILVAGATTIYAVRTGEAVFLDVAIVLALIAFLGTVAFATYIEKQASQ